MPVIEAIDLKKTYVSNKKQPGIWGGIKGLFSRQKNYVEAVKGITLKVEQGELVGFLGPNGAGKTTTLKMLTGILYPTSGEARVLGFKPFDRNANMLRQISLVMGNKNQLWWDLPAWDSFVVLKELYDVPQPLFKQRVDYLIDALQLTDKVNQQVRKMSLGERMKCELVAALLHAPKVVFLDEPTIGLDLVSQKRIREFLLELNRTEGSTIILTSHYMQDVEEVCDRVVVIDQGMLVFDGTLDSLTTSYSDSKRLRLTFDHDVPVEELEKFGQIVEKGDCDVILAIPSARTAAITGEILQRYSVSDVAIEAVSIEEVVRNLFSGESREAPP
jgi:ABC-2 type transport system ATP-binding protein